MPVLGLKTSLLAFGVYLLSLASTTSALEYIDYNAVASFPESYPGDRWIYKKFQPTLSVTQGCVPYPAVNGQGQLSHGLGTTGAINGGCSASLGQIYSRAEFYEGRFAIMYSWYFPKDQIAAGPGGHRNDWEGVVVWANHERNDAQILAICPSRHGKWHCDKSNFKLDGDRPKINYRPDGTHALFTTNDRGGSHPLIDWSRLPAAARNSLNEANFGAAVVPFKDSTFWGNLGGAKFW